MRCGCTTIGLLGIGYLDGVVVAAVPRYWRPRWRMANFLAVTFGLGSFLPKVKPSACDIHKISLLESKVGI